MEHSRNAELLELFRERRKHWDIVELLHLGAVRLRCLLPFQHTVDVMELLLRWWLLGLRLAAAGHCGLLPLLPHGRVSTPNSLLVLGIWPATE